MRELFGILLFLASPSLVVAGAAWFGALRSRFFGWSAIGTATVTQAVIIVLTTRETDAITNAAALYFLPVLCVYGLFVAIISAAIVRRLQ